MVRVASIDLGTNTFHLLIIDYQNGLMKEVYRVRFFVNLAEDGIQIISEKVKKRIYQAIAQFRIELDDYKVEKFIATGTAALRTASNGKEILDYIENEYQIYVDLISGDREAELIFKGTKLAFDFDLLQYLIMDIGGGSIEFILVEEGKISWVESFPIGISVLYNSIQKSNPITDIEIESIVKLLDQSLVNLRKVVYGKSIKYLVGASGSFDVIENITKNKKPVDKCWLVDSGEEFDRMYQKIVYSTTDEIALIDGIPTTRVKLMPIALILIDYILKLIVPEGILVSPYALKEGVLSEAVL